MYLGWEGDSVQFASICQAEGSFIDGAVPQITRPNGTSDLKPHGLVYMSFNEDLKVVFVGREEFW